MKKKTGYCIDCLRLFPRKWCPDDNNCPGCKKPLRFATRGSAKGVITRFSRQRGIKPTESKSPTKSNYRRYIAGEKWQEIRLRVLSRDGFKCQMCLKKANQVHHKSYDKDVLDGNRDDQLVSICRSCHKYIEFDKNGKKNGIKAANAKLESRQTSARLQPADNSQ